MSTYKFPERLVKFCEPRFNIARSCNTLRLGTTDEYAALEGKSPIGDSKEGKLTFIQTDDIINGVRMRECLINDFNYRSCYVFSTSLQDTVAPSTTYHDKYYINDPKSFLHLIERLLWEQRKAEDLKIRDLRTYKGFRALSSRINYTDEIIRIPPGKMDSISTAHLAFTTKRTKYRSDDEYRFVFIGYSRNDRKFFNLVEYDQGKILDLSEVRDELNGLVSLT